MANPRYKFFLRVGSTTAQAQEIVPVWKDEMALEWALESQQWFFRAAMSGSFNLIRDDYDLVMAQPFGTVFYFSVFMHDGSLWREYWQGKFTLTDCTVNTDDRKLTVKVQGIDDYNEILAGWEKEYDLIKLLPEMQKIKITKRPMIQIYSEGASYINCFIGQVYFEQDVNTPADDDIQGFLVNHCHFTVLDNYVEINFENPPAGFGAPFTGTLTNGAYLTNSIGTYRLKYFEETETIDDFVIYSNGLRAVLSNDDTVLWEFKQDTVGIGQYKPLPIEMKFEPKNGSTGTLTADRTSRYIYSRIVCNTPPEDGYDTYSIKSDDLVPYNRNYLYCRPYDGTYGVYADIFTFAYNGKSSDPTEWGMDDNGEYFTAPSYQGCYPIGRTNWVNTSDWYQPGWAANAIDEDYSYQYTLNNSYPIWSCIKVLLAEIAPTVKFEPSTAYSEFMFRQVSGEYSDPIGGRDCRLFITPKSNITAGEYDTPAQTAPVTLKTLLDMMAKTFCLHWFIESVDVGGGTIEKRLRIEHVKWFRQGGTYSGTQQIGIDLTAIHNVRNGKPWSFGTNEYSYEKADMPERYEFGWMDDVTLPFKGQPIEVVSPYIEKGKIENVDVGQFTSDIDLMLLNPSAFSPDGFAVMTMYGDALPMVPYSTTIYGGYIQNGLLAFVKLQNPYWLYDMPAKSLKVNGAAVTALGVSRNKSQTLSIPYNMTEPNLQKLVKTGIGNGQIRTLSMRLTSRMAKVTLRYDTETI